MPRAALTAVLLTALAALPAAFAAAPAAARPNIVVILADDLGAGDPRAYNPDSKIPTPALDRLAAEGLRFTNAYCPAAVCTPTRYALLTGRYAWRTDLGNGVAKNWEPPLIEPERLTLPELLRNVGYATIGIGKWHLGSNHPTTDGKPPVGRGTFGGANSGANIDFTRPVTGGPTDHGFDFWLGLNSASEGVVYEQAKPVYLLDPKNPPVHPSVKTLELKTFVELQPIFAQRVIDEVSRRAPAASAGKPFFLYFAPYVPHVPLAVTPEFKGKTQAGDYGDYVAQLDHDVGRVLDALDKAGIADNTLVLFASDNGSEFTTTGQGHRPNGALAGTKWTVREGGVRTPLIVRWPARIRPGTTSDALLGLNDLYATFAALAGVPVPAGAAEDSVNQLPVLLDPAAPAPRAELVVSSTANVHALRRGTWKFVAGEGDGRKASAADAAGQLYNLSSDPRETKNVVAQHPGVAAELRERLRALTAK